MSWFIWLNLGIIGLLATNYTVIKHAYKSHRTYLESPEGKEHKDQLVKITWTINKLAMPFIILLGPINFVILICLFGRYITLYYKIPS